MDILLARSLVWDALRRSVPHEDLIEDEHITLYDIGLSTPVHRDYFKETLVQLILDAGYNVDPDRIPTSASDTPIRIMSELPGHSTKDNEA